MRNVLLTTRAWAVALACLLALPAAAQPQRGYPFREQVRITPRDSVVQLAHPFIVPHTERFSIGAQALRDSLDYVLDPARGRVTFHVRALHQLVPVADTGVIVIAAYRALPPGVNDTIRHQIPATVVDSARKTSRIVSRPSTPFAIDQIFGPNLQKSGSIVRGFTIGSNRDLSLNSGLRMQMSGPLSRDLSLVAALTDENSPLQPEGTTRTLQEVDKVFVELHGQSVAATLGDFNVTMGGTEFGSISRKLQGARGVMTLETGALRSRVTAVGASPRGKYFSNELPGVDGVQGPYRLYGRNNEQQILVIAATERVYLNGERMTRGEGDDYTIEYSTAEITFTPRHLITRAARITVDFEYTDRQYDRSFLAGSAEESFLHDRWLFTASVARESDNENSPIDLVLADSDKALLRAAGGDQSKAVRSGVTLAGPGKGQYVRVDTLIALSTGIDSLISIYRFNPFDTLNAVYSVSFTFVGAGRGDYSKVTESRFTFTGLRQGDYLPIRMLPLPASQTVVNTALKGKLTDDLTLKGEFARSQVNANLFSSDPAARAGGSAVNVGLSYAAEALRLGGVHLGKASFEVHDRYLEKSFQPLDRVNTVEFNRIWNLTDSSSADEEDRQLTFGLQPVSPLAVAGSYGHIRRGDLLSSTRSSGSLAWKDSGNFSGTYAFDRVAGEDNVHATSDVWFRQNASVEERLGGWTPFVRYDGELLLSHRSAVDTLVGSSYRLHDVRPGIRLDSLGHMSVEMEFGVRYEDSLSGGGLRRAVRATSETMRWRLQDWNSIASMLDVSLLDKHFPNRSAGEDAGATSIALRWQGHYHPSARIFESDALYELLTERTAKLERVFQQVPQGTGNYRYAGDLNGNHIVDEPDFQPTRFDGDFIALSIPSDALIPVTGLRASTRLRFNGYQLGGGPDFLHPFSFETYARVEEKNSDPRKSDIYLLRFSHFLDEAQTIAGTSVLTQDCYLFETNPKFSMRLRYNQGMGLTQYALGTERTYKREQSVRVRWQLVQEFSNQTDVALQRDALAGVPGNPRVRDIGLTSFSTDWTYRPVQRIELGMRFGTARGRNFDSTTVGLNDQSVRFIYALTERGQWRTELTREEATILTGSGTVPFEMTGGRVMGQSWLWHVALDYRIAQSIQSSLVYDGRREGKGQTVHTARAEVRAFF